MQTDPPRVPAASPPAPVGGGPPAPAVVEVGWVLAGRLHPVDYEAVQQARLHLLERLQQTFPAFSWRMPVVHWKAFMDGERQTEPVLLLDQGVAERDARKWDFALVVTEADLRSYFKPFVLGAPAQALATAVLSTARIDPDAGGEAAADVRVRVLARRIDALASHLLGHLMDLPHSDDASDFMFNVRTVTDLDAMTTYAEDDRAEMQAALEDVADLRLEETGHFRGRAFPFYLKAAWHNRMTIGSALMHIRPWQFPFRLSRLTTAAASTLVVLVITAEAWDLGMSQPPLRVLGLSLTALGGTSFFILARQQLLLYRRAARLSEQRVVSNVAIVLAVLTGMTFTYVLLFGLTFALTQLLFSPTLVAGWAASLKGDINLAHYLTLAGFVAALGITIGALGASFEAKGYFRHVTYVDEET